MTIDFIMVEMVSRGTVYNACYCGAGMAVNAVRYYFDNH
jgi:hypothetical protein